MCLPATLLIYSELAVEYHNFFLPHARVFGAHDGGNPIWNFINIFEVSKISLGYCAALAHA